MLPRSLLLLVVALPLAAQPPGVRLKGEAESSRTRKRLTELQPKLADATPAVTDELQQILDQSGDDLVLTKDDQFQPARRLVHSYLAALPPKALATFRDRLEEPAKKLLAAGKAKRDPAPLRELTDRYFVSRPAEEALLLLGELAFERGDFVTAARHWRTLLPGDADGELRYPNPTTDPALVKAKLILARHFGGDTAGAAADLAAFGKEHPKASGRLAGADGVLADALAKQLAAPPPAAPAPAWTTFAGGPARDGRPPADLPRYWPGGRPTWRAAIPRDGDDKGRDKPKPANVPAGKTLAFHPVIVGGYAYVADAGRVFRFDLATGSARIAFHSATLDEPPNFPEPTALALPNVLDTDYTLTAADGVLYARLGPLALPADETARKPRTFLVALEPALPKETFPLRAKWQLAPPVKPDVPAVWEGAPLAAGGKLYAAFVRVENGKTLYAVACYPPAGGKPLWVADVGEADGRPAKNRNELLTLAGSNVVYATHAGVTVALNAATGKPAWAFRNPPADKPPTHPARDLCPPVYSAGRVFIAPADGDAVYALDADTGRKLWATNAPVQVEQLLGVSGGRLIATTQKPGFGMVAYDVATGGKSAPDGWHNADAPGLPTHGRGLAGKNLILWPTLGAGGKPKLERIDPATGRVAMLQPVYGPAGNLAAGENVVIVATATEVWGYLFEDGAPVIPERADEPLIGAKDPPKFDPAAKVIAAAVPVLPGIPSLDELKSVPLPPNAVPLVPLMPADAPLILCDGKTLYAVDADTGKPLWDAPLKEPARFRSSAHTSDGLTLALGDTALAGVKGGKLLWQFAVPPADPTPTLSAFTFVGNRLVAKLGRRGVVAFDLNTGVVAWAADASGGNAVRAFARDGAAAFGPHIGAAGGRVFVQREGEAWELDADTGKRTDTYPAPLPDWTGPPAEWKRKAVLPAADGGLALAGESAKLLDGGRAAGRTGAPPAVWVFGDTLLTLTPRNVGDEVQTVPKASRPALLPPAVDLPNADADDNRYYLPAGNVLIALNRETLKEAWRAALPELPNGVRWRVIAGRTTVACVPTEAIGERGAVAPAGRAGGVSPLFLAQEQGANAPRSPAAVLASLAALFDTATRRTLPVILLDTDTGQQTARADVPATGPAVAVIPRPSALLIATSGRAVWLGKK